MKLMRKFILMMGAPGVGKGTYSRMLSKDLKVPELSSGEELRKLPLNEDTVNIKEQMNRGELVDNEFVINLIENRLSRNTYDGGAILDGFPRNLYQAKYFDEKSKLDLVIKINLDEEIIVRKLLGRRVCEDCGKGYNICNIKEGEYDMEPLLPRKVHNKCDDCDGALIERKDDNEETIRQRIVLYNRMTQPLEEFYKSKGRILIFEPKRGLKDYPNLINLVRKEFDI